MKAQERLVKLMQMKNRVFLGYRCSRGLKYFEESDKKVLLELSDFDAENVLKSMISRIKEYRDHYDKMLLTDIFCPFCVLNNMHCPKCTYMKLHGYCMSDRDSSWEYFKDLEHKLPKVQKALDILEG